MTLTEFWTYVYSTHRTLGKHQRLGQYTFNVLEQYRPDLAKQVAMTDMDPFYLREDRMTYSPVWTKFDAFLQEKW